MSLLQVYIRTYRVRPPLRLRGGAGGRKKDPAVPSRSVLVSKLTPEQLVERKEYEKIRKQRLRARNRGVTHGEYQENIVKKVVARVEKKETAVRERGVRAEGRRVFREELDKDREAWKRGEKNWNQKGARGDPMKGVGRRIRSNRNRLRTLLRRNLAELAKVSSSEDWEDTMTMLRKAREAKPLEIKSIMGAYDGALEEWRILGEGHKDAEVFLDLTGSSVGKVVKGAKGPSKKLKLALRCRFRKWKTKNEKDGYTDSSSVLSTPVYEITQDSDFDEVWPNAAKNMLTKLSEHTKVEGSGWWLVSITDLTVYLSSYNPLAGRGYIPIPKHIRSKHAVLNLRNKGVDCFVLSVAAGEFLHERPEDRPSRMERIPKILKMKAGQLKMGGLQLPMKLEDIGKFEDLNPTLSVSVYGMDENESVIPYYHRRRMDGVVRKDIKLFYWGSGGREETYHYSPVTDFSALTAAQSSKKKAKTNRCGNCLHNFSSVERLARHDELAWCYTNECQETEYVDRKISFENHRKTQRMPFVIYADTKAFDTPVEHPPGATLNTVKLSEQTISGIGYLIVGPPGYKTVYKKFVTKKAFRKSLDKDVRAVYRDWFAEGTGKPIMMSKRDAKNFDRASLCYQCMCPIQGRAKKRDHDHFTGRYRGAACSTCNLKMRVPRSIKAYLHNLKGYDSHLLIQEIAKMGPMECLPNNVGSYRSFSVKLTMPYRVTIPEGDLPGMEVPEEAAAAAPQGQDSDSDSSEDEGCGHDDDGSSDEDWRSAGGSDCSDDDELSSEYDTDDDYDDEDYGGPGYIPNRGRKGPPKFEIQFLDSFALMSSGLGSLVDALRPEDMKITREMFKNITYRKSRLLKRKGVYPYNWVDGPEKLKQTFLPPIEAFYNTLTETPCAEEDYEHAQAVSAAFGIRTMQGYHDLYLKSDVCQLADVVEGFRDMCMRVYGLDPPWYCTSPGIAWDAMLKMTGVVLDTVADPDVFLFLERGRHGGVSVVTKRHGEANHKHMKDHDPTKPSTYIYYLDMNNLYGAAMVKTLPRCNLKWMEQHELDNWTGMVGAKFGEDTGRGCFLEVDLKYPDRLHDLHSDLPMACESMEMGASKAVKLVPNLNDKKEYVIHHDELRWCLEQGIVLEKIHRGVSFDQSDWLAPYILMNTKLRAECTTEFGRDFFKLMNNSVYGKTMENVRNWTEIKLVTEKWKLGRWMKHPRYKDATAFVDGTREPLTAVRMGAPKVVMNKPIYAGVAVLSISKVEMQKFYYDYVVPKWGRGAVDLLFTDTDSLCLEIRTEDLYADVAPDVPARFDTSNIPKDHPAVLGPAGLPRGANKKVLGMMKDEVAGKNIVEFVGLRPKSYALRMEGDREKALKKSKGIKRYVVENLIGFDEYKECLFGGGPVYKMQNTLRSRDHRMYVERMCKKALCGEDNKRVILEDGVRTLPWGHYSLRAAP